MANSDYIPAEWEKDIPDREFVSHSTSYQVGKYFDLFDQYTYPNAETGDIKYYVYDPIKHGATADGKYPLIVFFHGAGNSMDGINVINYSMAEYYASQEYQKTIGGAYLLVPIANEKVDEKGELVNGWSGPYYEPVINIKRQFIENHKANIGKTFFMGTSDGAFFLWGMISRYSKEIDVAVPVSGGFIPDEAKLKEVHDNGTLILSMHGKHDELIPFDDLVTPHLEKLSKFDNIITWYPEWIHNSDGGIAQMAPGGMQMGQHCLCNQITANLIYDDGKPYNPELFPQGMTGWIRDHK